MSRVYDDVLSEARDHLTRDFAVQATGQKGPSKLLEPRSTACRILGNMIESKRVRTSSTGLPHPRL